MEEPKDPPSRGGARILSTAASVAKTIAVGARNSLSGLVSARTLSTGVAVVLLLYLFDFITIPFPPFTTTGKIYVDSPEVYTRERLVNDRYDQDFWLRQRLEKLNTPEELHLLVAEEVGSVEVGAGEGGDNEAGGNPQERDRAESHAAARRLPFEQEFRIASGIRDMIRQQVFENMLDDRHDLNGNTLYGLKFDTTVIPGSNTRSRAFVHVGISIDDLFRVNPSDTTGLGEHIEGYVASRLRESKSDSETRRDRADEMLRRHRKREAHYLAWLRDIEKRLNQAEDWVYADMKENCPGNEGREFYDKLTAKTLDVVLRLQDQFWRLNAPKSRTDPKKKEYLRLPNPWASFFHIGREPSARLDETNGALCKYRVSFFVVALTEIFVAEKGKAEVSETDDEADAADERRSAVQKRLYRVYGAESGKWTVKISENRFRWRSQVIEKPHNSKYPLTPALIDVLVDTRKQQCKRLVDRGSPCPPEFSRQISVPSGLFNFAEQVSGFDPYSYAIFPKSDVIGVAAEGSVRLAAAAGLSGFLDLAKHVRESRTAAVLVGFGDGGGLGPPEEGANRDAYRFIRFGWVISARGDMEPIQKSQLALVSLPAWTDRLDLRIRVGWLDRNGNPEIDEDGSFDLRVAVPSSLSVFDSMLLGGPGGIPTGPYIRDHEMDPIIQVRAGEEAKILIPGSRLWRSATVTLGAQMAKRIRVLPNMEGIIAEFDPVELPHLAERPETGARKDRGVPHDSINGDSAVVPEADGFRKYLEGTGDAKRHRPLPSPVKLKVWTSEGVADVKRPVYVVYGRDELYGVAPGAGPRENGSETGVSSARDITDNPVETTTAR